MVLWARAWLYFRAGRSSRWKPTCTDSRACQCLCTRATGLPGKHVEESRFRTTSFGSWMCGQRTYVSRLGLMLTQFTAAGGQVGPEVQRAYRVYEAYELAQRCAVGAERGRHVVCMGDLNSLPDSLCMALLKAVGGLGDAFDSGITVGTGITCDSPENTWTGAKKLDAQALEHAGKRLDYVLFRGPHHAANRLACTGHAVVFSEVDPTLRVSYSDHFGVLTTFAIVPPHTDAALPGRAEPRPAVLRQALTSLHGALEGAQRSQRKHMRYFMCLLGTAAILVGANACASAWLSYGQSVAPSVVLSLLLIVAAWAGTTALYSGVIWGRWEQRT